MADAAEEVNINYQRSPITVGIGRDAPRWLPAVIADPDGALADRLGLNNGGRVVVRPDGYIGARPKRSPTTSPGLRGDPTRGCGSETR
jgi:hypothetical protein